MSPTNTQLFLALLCIGMQGSADLVHLTRREIDYQKPSGTELMHQKLHSRVVQVLLTLLVLLAGTIDPHAQDVQMIPDQTDRESAEKAQRHKSEEEEPVTTLKARS